jgi:superfamily II DNA helicase RecQ
MAGTTDSTPYRLPEAVRTLILQRDEYRCRNCDSTAGALNVHHLWPKQFGIDHSPANLITLCRQCHAAYHPETQATFFLGVYQTLKRGLMKLFGDPAEPEQKLTLALHLLVGDPQARFRSIQQQGIETVLRGGSALVVMPTGAGKSLCYQVPALLFPEHTLVISPLKALMYDQTHGLIKSKVNATYLNSDLPDEERKARLNMIRQGLFKIITAAPERFFDRDGMPLHRNLGELLQIRYSLLVIDEAHCIDKWDATSGRRIPNWQTCGRPSIIHPLSR